MVLLTDGQTKTARSRLANRKVVFWASSCNIFGLHSEYTHRLVRVRPRFSAFHWSFSRFGICVAQKFVFFFLALVHHLVPRLTGSGAWIPAPNNKGLKTEKLNYCSKSKSEIVYFFRILDCFRSIFSETWQLRSKSEFLFDSYLSAFSQLKHFGIIKTRENEKIGFTTTDT